MNNQFSQKVSDIIVYSKEEANRLKSSYIGPEHLLLGMLRDGEGKAIEILSKLKTNLTDIKKQIEAILKEHADDMLLPDADVPLSNGAAKILKLCILEARVMKSQVADTEHVLLAILKDKDNLAATVLEANHVNYQQVFEQLSLQPDISAGMGFTEDDDDEEEMNQSRSSHGSGERQQQAQTASRKPTNDTPVLDNFGTDMTKAAEEGRLDDKEFSRSVIQKALNKSFAPEFINRVDEIITFDQLSLEAITKIIDIELKGLYNRIESIGYKLVIEDKVKQFVASKGYDVQYGARPLKRAIQTYLEDGLSELIISADLNEGDTITVSLNEEKGELEMKNEAKTAE